jgi:D-alanine-D-alanine ligase
MKVGLTYDLRQDYLSLGMSEEDTAEFDRPDTIDAIENTLKALGYETDRIGHIRSLVNRLAQGQRWDLVFNIAEGLWGFGREAQIPALLEAYQIPYTFSDSLVLALTLHKGLTKHVIRDQGIPTPDFYVIEKEADIKHVHLAYPLFAKPVAEGTGKGVTARSVIQTKRELASVCKLLLDTYKQPVLIETFLPGREFTVGIVGTGEDARAVGALEVVLLKNAEQDVYSYVNKEKCEELVKYCLAEDDMAKAAADVAVASWRALGCRDAGRIDLRSDEKGQPHFIEVNPLAGIHPEHSDLPILCTKVGIPYKELIKSIMQSAEKRLPAKKK